MRRKIWTHCVIPIKNAKICTLFEGQITNYNLLTCGYLWLNHIFKSQVGNLNFDQTSSG